MPTTLENTTISTPNTTNIPDTRNLFRRKNSSCCSLYCHNRSIANAPINVIPIVRVIKAIHPITSATRRCF